MLNNILLCSICAVVLTGTTYPLFAELLFGAKLSVGPPYFQRDGVAAARSRCSWPCRSARCCRGSAPSSGPALLRLWWAALIAALVGIATALGLAWASPRSASPQRPG